MGLYSGEPCTRLQAHNRNLQKAGFIYDDTMRRNRNGDNTGHTIHINRRRKIKKDDAIVFKLHPENIGKVMYN